ncbi:cytochrome c [Ramlibacter sp.]|jgi:cytochrome c556|uniref:c-type cytochrome n=1 Tax=Ramlibacter sp. TaxID=1917967 RepID=UPI00262ABB0B|nr:cytochrome c [Ramlibacter sp.]MDB5958477.1 putative Cytochrome c [Ramlibacter sp.]
MKFAATLALAAAAFALASPASAQSFQKPEDAIKYRQGAFRVLGAHFGALGAMAQGKAPYDAQAAAHHADVIALVSHLPFTAFAAGTEKGENTHAKPEIWTEQAKFKENAEKMQDAVAKLAAAAKTGSVDNLKAAFGPAGQTCKACHDSYREKL